MLSYFKGDGVLKICPENHSEAMALKRLDQAIGENKYIEIQTEYQGNGDEQHYRHHHGQPQQAMMQLGYPAYGYTHPPLYPEFYPPEIYFEGGRGGRGGSRGGRGGEGGRGVRGGGSSSRNMSSDMDYDDEYEDQRDRGGRDIPRR
jgi:hypothetical protein